MSPCTRAAVLAGALACGLAHAGATGSVASTGCTGTPTAPRDGTYTLAHGGHARTYGLRLPAAYDPRHPAPLVLVFHGWGGDESEFLADPAVVAESSRRGYVLVAPRGLGSGPPDSARNSWTFRGSATGVIGEGAAATPICDASITPDYSYRSCHPATARNSCSWTQCQDDDVAFVRALVERLEAQLCIDKSRVFASGGSNGGMFTWELGANPATAPLFRAIAPIIGLPHRGDLRPPAREGGLPVLLITGLADPVVPPGRGDDPASTTTSNDSDRYYYTGATAITRLWSKAAGCAVDRSEHAIHVGITRADCRAWCDASPGKWPRVAECRAPMQHEYQFDWSWKAVLDFFDGQ
jgi:poly(3-hydroxybutyrate) depolymerase